MLLERLTGVVVPQYRWPVIESQLQRMGKPLPVSPGILEHHISEQGSLAEKLAALMTIPETYLFRHFEHYQQLEEIACHRYEQGQACRVLCAGCSTGEEVWSAAAVLFRRPAPLGLRHQVVGWELCGERLRRAEEGHYNAWSSRRGFFGYEDLFHEHGDGCIVDDALRRMVSFTQANLVTALPRAEPFDVVFFRNVSMYWKQETVESFWQQLMQLTNPGSVVFVGPSDPFPTTVNGWVHHITRTTRCFLRSTTQAGAWYPQNQQPAPEPTAARDEDVCPTPQVRPEPSNRPTRLLSPWAEIIPEVTAGSEKSVDEADHAVDKEVQEPPVESVDRVLDQVRELADQGRYEEALSMLRGEHAACSRTVESKLWEGILQLSLNCPREAVTMFRQCVFLHPHELEFRNWLAVAYEAAGRSRDAERERVNIAQLGES